MKKREMNQEDDALMMQDEKESASNSVGSVDFLQKNLKTILIGVAAVAAIILVVLFLKNKAEEDSKRASILLTRVMPYYETGDFEKALNGDPTRTYLGESVKGLKYIADEFSGTDQGKMAALYTANALINTGKQKESVKYFEIAAGSSANVIKIGANAGIASGLEIDGKYTEAAKLYTECSNLTDEENIKARYMFYSGLCYEKSGDKKQAESVYREIIKINEFGEFGIAAKSGLSRIGTIIE